jgi:hypothetical protein
MYRSVPAGLKTRSPGLKVRGYTTPPHDGLARVIRDQTELTLSPEDALSLPL